MSVLSTAFAVLAVAGGFQDARPSADALPADVRFHTRHFATSGAGADAQLVALSPEGRVLRHSLAATSFVFGPGERVALLGPELDGERVLRVLDRTLEQRLVRTVGADRAVRLSAQGLVLVPRADHAAGTAIELEFLDTQGRSLASFQEREGRLLDVVAQPAGGWVALWTGPEGGHVVARFDDHGTLLWRHVVPSEVAPLVVTAARTGYTAIVTTSVFGASTLELLDRGGRVVARLDEAPAACVATFAPDGRTLALRSDEAVTLVASRDARVLWRRPVRDVAAHGDGLAFSDDGRSLATVSLALDARAEPTAVTYQVFRSADGRSLSSRPVPSADARGLSVVSLEHAVDGWQLVTRSGRWSLDS